MTKKRGLGRGFDAFITDKHSLDTQKPTSDDKIQNINLTDITPRHDQPRRHFDEKALEELSQSIKEHGVLQPILLNDKGDTLEIVAGERRYRASQLAGLETVPAIIRTFDDIQRDKISLIENVQREDLSPIEEAHAYKAILDSYHITQQELAQAIGKSRPYISNAIRLLSLDYRVLDMITQGKLSRSMGRELLTIEDHDEQYNRANDIIKRGLSVSQVAKTTPKPKTKRPQTATPPERNIHIVQVEQDFEDRLGTRVHIDDTKQNITIDYYDHEDLQRIIEIIIGE